MISRWRWLLLLFARKLWLRVTLMAIVGVATAVAGIVLPPYVPDAWTVKIGAQAIDGILNVLASSMLAVTVFSLSTMVAAYGAATTNVTPRATRLLMEDNTSQNVLGTFIGSFLFSLVGIIALSTGAYGDQGRAILLVVTIGLIVVIAATILRWIDYLARFGRLSETIERVEEATWKAMETRLASLSRRATVWPRGGRRACHSAACLCRADRLCAAHRCRGASGMREDAGRAGFRQGAARRFR